ncbi:hypothetical protein S40293_10601 [Stachybotrys chartarum IBT 40293]|nr:hypothetical protein S40293_10601 [Stachybotrys chartarum IBT 40293]
MPFHRFADLPAETRLAIWKTAVRPKGPNCGGIQEVTIYSVVDPAVQKAIYYPTTFRESVRLSTDSHVHCIRHVDDNRSAYLWDHGLWTVCWELHSAIRSAFGIDAWTQRQRHFWTEICQGITLESSLWEAIVDMPTIQCFSNSESQSWSNRLPLMFQPCQDAIFLDFANMRACATTQNGNGYLVWRFPDVGTLVNTIAFACFCEGICPPKSIVLGFDPTWNHELSSCFWDVQDEISPRGLALTLLAAITRTSDDLNGFIWLIDRSTHLKAALEDIDKVSTTERGRKVL